MRIAVDARELLGHPRGVGRFLEGVLESWLGHQPEFSHEVVLIVPHGRPRLEPRLMAGCRVVSTGHRPSVSGTYWEQAVLPHALERERADVLFAPGYTLPVLTRVPCVLAVHDLSFETHPEWFSGREGVRRRVLTRASVNLAQRVVTGSRFAARELARLYGVPRR